MTFFLIKVEPTLELDVKVFAGINEQSPSLDAGMSFGMAIHNVSLSDSRELISPRLGNNKLPDRVNPSVG